MPEGKPEIKNSQENPAESPKDNKKDDEISWKELLRFTILAAIILLPVRFFVAEPYLVRGASMDPTFKNNDYLIVDHISLIFEKPQRGDIVIFKSPIQNSMQLIKRVTGLPGETVIIKGNEVTIKNRENPNGFKLNESYVKYPSANDLTIELRDNNYFVMGDNRAASFDSRSWGILPEKLIVGKPILRLFPFNKIGLRPGTEQK